MSESEQSDNTEIKLTNLQKIKKGFKINSMKMKNGENGKVLWECKEWDMTIEKKSESLPKEILKCKEIVREINFSSVEQVQDLELIQNFYLCDEMVESSRFIFGFVIPNSTNSWEQHIEAKQEMIPYTVLSGNLVVETLFLSNGHVIFKNNILIYYV
jgi:retinal rod rhodopsin-sensitive cGMP 3',5'-cyclic phosphodiesterase subunit delta